MRAIGSDRGHLRLTLRLRLTLLYGACFLAAGAAVLAITYGLVAQDTVNRQGFIVRGVKVNLPGFSKLANQVAIAAVPAGGVGVARSGERGAAEIVTRPTIQALRSNFVRDYKLRGKTDTVSSPPAFGAGLLAALQSSSQKQLNGVVKKANVELNLQRRESLTALLERSGVALAIMALLSIGLGWLVAGRGLRPLRTMNMRARRITEDNLHERLGADARDDELGELAATFDAVLARLEQAFDSQRRFVANASHELRTPITLERALLEVALADPEATIDSLRRTCERVLAAGEQQERVIEALLTLARGQAGITARATIDISMLVEELLAERELATAPIEVETTLEPAVIAGDPALLERLVANLLDNAVVHNDGERRWIRVQTGTVGDTAELRVANSGPIVAEDQIDDLFEPFRRLGGERTSSGGLGLGLSIVRAIGAAHGASISAAPLAGGGLELTVQFAALAEPEDETVAPALAGKLPPDPFSVQRA